MSQILDEIEVKPKQPWKPTQKEINTNIGIFVFNILQRKLIIQNAYGQIAAKVKKVFVLASPGNEF